MGRILRVLGAATLGLGLVAAGPGAAKACACGAAIGDEKFEQVEETALVELSGGREAITLNLAADTEATSAAFIMPVPTRADFELADGALFTELHEISKPRVVYREVERDGDDGAAGGAPPTGGDDVTVTDHVNVGPYEVAQLSGKDSRAVASWLGEQNFTLPGNLTEQLTPYLQEGWHVVAVHLEPEKAETLDGGLPPMRMAFTAEEPVYPMRLSAAADHSQPLRLYVLADNRMEVSNPAPGDDPPELTFAGTLTPSDVSAHPELAELVDRPRFLTRYDARFDPADITGDIHLTQAATNEEHQDVVTRTRYVDPDPLDALGGSGGVLALSAGVVAGTAAIGAVVVVVVRRRRGDPDA